MKKGLKITLITAACVLAVAGGVAAYVRFAPQKSVDVVPAGNWMMNYMPNQSYVYGVVSSDASQTVLKDEERKILEVLVAVGDTVAVGDPLVRYDTTMDELTLEEKLLEREKLFNSLNASYKEYAKYARTPYPSPLTETPAPQTPTPVAEAEPAAARGVAGAGIVRLSGRGRGVSAVRLGLSDTPGGDGSSGSPYTYGISDSEQVSVSFLAQLSQLAVDRGSAVYAVLTGTRVTVQLTFGADRTVAFSVTAPDPNPGSADLSTPVRGSGSESDPYVYAYTSNTAIGAGFVSARLNEANTAQQAVFVKLAASGFAVGARFNADGTFAFQVTLVTPTATPSPTPDPNATPTPTPSPTLDPAASSDPIDVPSGGGMSRAEREEYARETAKKIREDEAKYRQLGLDIQKLQLSGANGILYCTVDGAVTAANDPDSVSNGEPVVEVRGGSGMHVVSVLSEMDLPQYPVGTELEGFAYESGVSVTVRIASVGTMPLTTSYSNGGNANASGYMAVMEIIGDAQPKLYEYIEFSSYQPMAESGQIYLHEAFIREEGGASYVFVMRGETVVREQVTTGKRIDSYIELVGSDLTMDDYICFPYDKNCKDGAPANITDGSVYYG